MGSKQVDKLEPALEHILFLAQQHIAVVGLHIELRLVEVVVPQLEFADLPQTIDLMTLPPM